MQDVPEAVPGESSGRVHQKLRSASTDLEKAEAQTGFEIVSNLNATLKSDRLQA